MLHELVNGGHRAERLIASPIVGSGAVARVTKANTGAGTIEGSVAEFDGGVFAFGPVPCRDLSGSVDPVAVDDEVLLIVTSDGQPYAALKFI